MTGPMKDLYVAQDYDQGKILVVTSNSAQGDNWSFLDLNSRKIYVHTPDAGCQMVEYGNDETKKGYELLGQCLPSDAKLERSGDVDFYSMGRTGINWLVGMKPLADTDFFFMHLSRFLTEVSAGLTAVPRKSPFSILYQFSVGISDPTVFDKDLSGCVAA